MAVVDIMESFEGWAASVQQETGYGSTSGTAARVFTVQFDNIAPENQLLAIYASAGGTTIPAIAAAFKPAYPDMICTRVIPKVTSNPYLFEVRCLYAGKDSPLAQPWEYSGGAEQSVVEVSADINGNPYLNPLDDPVFGVQRELVERTVIISRNEANWNNYRDETWLNKINSDAINLLGLSRAAKTVKLQTTAGKRVVQGATYYHPVTYTFRVREPKWGITAPQIWQRRRLCYGGYSWSGDPGDVDPTTGKKIGQAITRQGVYNCYAALHTDGTIVKAGEAFDFQFSDEFEAVPMADLGMV